MERSFAGLPKPVPLLAASPSRSTKHLGHHGLGFGGRRVGMQQVLIADDRGRARAIRPGLPGALDAFDDEGAGSSAEHLRLAEPVDMAGGTNTGRAARSAGMRKRYSNGGSPG